MLRRRWVGLAVAAMVVMPAFGAGNAFADPADADGRVASAKADYDPVKIHQGPLIAVPPEMDPGFYDPPQRVLDAKEPGELISARRVTIATYSALPVNVDSWQVSYRSTDTHGNAIPAVATLLKPRGKTPDGKPRPLLSFQSATDGLARYCEPSYQYQLASVPHNFTGSASVGNEILQVQAALTQGWAVVVADTQGPKSAYAAGPLQARVALDGIRAAQRFAPMGLPGNETKVGMAGYSGGAITTNWAAEILNSYAPELNVVGAAAGGTQPELDVTLNMANGQATAGLILAAVVGLSREYPELKSYIDDHITPEGRVLLQAKDNLCLTYTALALPFLDNKALLRGGDPLRHPKVRSVIDKTRMGQTTPDVPLLIWQSNPDWVAPVAPVNRLVDKYCADGGQVEYIRDHFSEHVSMAVLATPTWMLWLRDRFADRPVESGCTTTDVGSIALDQRTWSVWVQVVGDLLAGMFGKPLGAGK